MCTDSHAICVFSRKDSAALHQFSAASSAAANVLILLSDPSVHWQQANKLVFQGARRCQHSTKTSKHLPATSGNQLPSNKVDLCLYLTLQSSFLPLTTPSSLPPASFQALHHQTVSSSRAFLCKISNRVTPPLVDSSDEVRRRRSALTREQHSGM